jgi:hypothetical protein
MHTILSPPAGIELLIDSFSTTIHFNVFFLMRPLETINFIEEYLKISRSKIRLPSLRRRIRERTHGRYQGVGSGLGVGIEISYRIFSVVYFFI